MIEKLKTHTSFREFLFQLLCSRRFWTSCSHTRRDLPNSGYDADQTLGQNMDLHDLDPPHLQTWSIGYLITTREMRSIMGRAWAGIMNRRLRKHSTNSEKFWQRRQIRTVTIYFSKHDMHIKIIYRITGSLDILGTQCRPPSYISTVYFCKIHCSSVWMLEQLFAMWKQTEVYSDMIEH